MKKKDYVKFEIEYYYDKEGLFQSKKKCIEKSDKISEKFLDDLWDNVSVDESELFKGGRR